MSEIAVKAVSYIGTNVANFDPMVSKNKVVFKITNTYLCGGNYYDSYYRSWR